MKDKKRIFIASSSDLANERQKLKILLYDEGFEPVLWEDFDQSIGKEQFQTWINKNHLKTSDVVIFMVKSQLGKFTLEEFKTAYGELGKSIESMYVYFLDPGKLPPQDESDKIHALKIFLAKEEGKLYIEKTNYVELENHFLKQIKHIHKKEHINTDICHSDTKTHIKILLTISVLISKAECTKYNICIEYQELKKELMKNYDEKVIDTSLAFLIIKDFIDKGKMIDDDLTEIEYVKLLHKANKVIVQQSELLKQIKKKI